jgi:lipoprotein-anchoring transpeptidase ErfK/SrfK
MTVEPRRKGAWMGIVASALLALTVAGCTSSDDPSMTILTPTAMYGQVQDGDFTIPAVPPGVVAPQYFRQVVTTPAYISATPGTIVVDPSRKFLYLVQDGGRSMRYGIGVGREGFAWSGDAVIKSKQEWPKWFPPLEMQARDPEAAKYPNGMEGGLRNPLGARALYLYQGNKDTLYRLHGTNDPRSIGKAVSSGCVRLLNQDIIDLYGRVPLGTKVVVLGTEATSPMADIFVPRQPPVAIGAGVQIPAG